MGADIKTWPEAGLPYKIMFHVKQFAPRYSDPANYIVASENKKISLRKAVLCAVPSRAHMSGANDRKIFAVLRA